MSPDARKAERARLVRFLGRGGLVVRESVGGVIGVRCCGAARNGREFSPEALARLIETGCVRKGQPYAVVPVSEVAGDVFRLQLLEPADG